MKKRAKKILATILTVVMLVTMVPVQWAGADEKAAAINVTISIEKFTIGQGYLLEPVVVQVPAENASAAIVLEKAAEQNNIKINKSSYGYYLDNIENADSGVINIPQLILDMPNISVDYGYGPIEYATPTNDSKNALFEDNKKLGTGSYSELAGWMYSVNNVSSQNAFDQQPVKDGDVIRVQFSVYAAGADLGFGSWYENIENATLANKDRLTRAVAELAIMDDYKKGDKSVQSAKAKAMEILVKYDATQEEVDQALENLNSAVNSVVEPMPVIPKVKKASIKTLKNNKKRTITVTVKNVSNAVGYQYKYSTKKSLKNARIKTIKKNQLVIKKLKKKTRYYVRVRAYVLVNKMKVFGAWSNRKSVMVRK